MSTPILTFAMPEYGRAAEKKQQTSYLTSLVQWLQLKKYQYEVTFSLYMLTSTEKFIFSTSTSLPLDRLTRYIPTALPQKDTVINSSTLYTNYSTLLDFILFLLVSLLVTAATLYLPSHIAVIYNRMSYYVHGEYAYNTALGPAGETISFAKDGLRATSEAIGKATMSAMAAGVKEL